jgi:hypothetical protein
MNCPESIIFCNGFCYFSIVAGSDYNSLGDIPIRDWFRRGAYRLALLRRHNGNGYLLQVLGKRKTCPFDY